MHYIPSDTINLSLQELAPAFRQWRFDLLSALIGAVIAFILAGLLYAFRGALRRVWESVAVELGRFMNYMRASADENYRRLVAAKARSLIIPAHVAPLEALFVEPKLLATFRSPLALSETGSVAAGPRFVPLHRMLEGHPRLVLFGGSGMGKTTVLAYLALVCATAFEESEKRHVDPGAIPESVWKRLPLYITLPVIGWGAAGQEEENLEEGEASEEEATVAQETRRVGGVDDLIKAAVSAVDGGGGYVGALRQYLESGRAIVLVDGWDLLTSYQRQQAAAWLADLADAAPGNMWLVAVGTRGYAPLTEVGFASLTLAEWNATQVEAFAGRWVAACAPESASTSLSHDLMVELQSAARSGASLLELSLRAFVYLSDRRVPAGNAALFDRVLDLLLQEQAEEEPWWLATCRAALGQVALELQQGGRSVISSEEIQAAIEAALPPHEERPVRAVSRVFQSLTGARGLFRSVGSGQYTFIHPLWQAYLAARQLVAFDPATLVEWLEDPLWVDVFPFYAELGDVKLLVDAWLRTPDDVFYTRLRTLGSWIGAAPEGTAWREGAMAILARVFLQPGIHAPTRRLLADALVSTGVSGVAYFLKQALKNPETDVRIAAVLGLSRVAKETDIPAFEAMLADEDVLVREAAVQALAKLGSDAATRRLGLVLLEGEDDLRPVAAAALASCGEESVELLGELADSEDMMTRRAVVFGLAQVGARGLLEKMGREDGQWVVRTAAATALEELEAQEKSPGVPPLPDIEQLPWLISWAATKGEGLGMGDAARQMLRRALAEGDERVRCAAAQVLAQVGRPDDIEGLRAALADPALDVVSAAMGALEGIGRRYDLSIRRK
ncbi:MAG: HEAT repeat domain-containing protein [Anaerolineae bacterium]|nr:HEAT repeat domain-containing protein [Anaerolineae bacterium]